MSIGRFNITTIEGIKKASEHFHYEFSDIEKGTIVALGGLATVKAMSKEIPPLALVIVGSTIAIAGGVWYQRNKWYEEILKTKSQLELAE